MKRIVIFMAFSVIVPLAASAAPLKRALVADDARWVAHLDMEALKQTALGRFIDGEMRAPEQDRKVEAFRAMFAFDPRDDLKSLTAYGAGEEGVLLMEGRFDGDRILTMVRGNDEYAATPYQGDTIHSWVEKKELGKLAAGATAVAPVRKFGALLKGGLAIASERESSLKKALDVYRGRSAPLAPGGALGARIPKESVPFFAAGKDFSLGKKAGSSVPGATPSAPGQSGTFEVRAGEEEGMFFCDATMDAADDRTAAQAQAAVQGLLALTMISQDTDPKLAALLRGISCVGEGRRVRFSIRHPAANLVDVLREQKLKKTLPLAPGTPGS